MSVKRFGRSVALMLALGLLLAACGSDDDAGPVATSEPDAGDTGGEPGDGTDDQAVDDEWAEVVAAAEEEGRVVVYASMPGYEAFLEEQWAESYPNIDLELLRQPSGELRPRLDEERELGLDGADIAMLPEERWYDELAAAGDLLEIVHGPNVAEWEGLEQVEASPYYITPMHTHTVWVFNTEIVEPFTDVCEVTNPEYEGLVTILDIVANVIANYYELYEEKCGEDFLTDLAAVNPTLTRSVTGISETVAAGEFGIGVITTSPSVVSLKEEGAPIERAVMDPTLVSPYRAAVVGWANHPNAAMVWMDWILGRQVQEEQVELLVDGVTALPGVEGSADISEMAVYEDTAWSEERLEAYRAHFESAILGR